MKIKLRKMKKNNEKTKNLKKSSNYTVKNRIK